MPIITDPDTDDFKSPPSNIAADIKAKTRYTHAGETVRAYCQESDLTLVAVVCASRTVRPPPQQELPTPAPSPPRAKAKVKFIDDIPTPPEDELLSLPPTSSSLVQLLRPLRQGALTMTDERALLSLYRSNIVEPISMIRELRDLLSASALAGKGRSRVIFVNGNEGMDADQIGSQPSRNTVDEKLLQGAMQVVGSARGEAARLLRAELGGVGIDVCEVVVGT